MEIGDDEPTDSALKHSKFHKARRELLRSKSSSSTASSKTEEDTPPISTGPSTSTSIDVAGVVEQQGLAAPSLAGGVIADQPSVSPSSSASTLLEGSTSASTSAYHYHSHISDVATAAAAAATFPETAAGLLPGSIAYDISSYAPLPPISTVGTNEGGGGGVIVTNPLHHSPYMRQKSCPEPNTSSSISLLAASTSREVHSDSSVPGATTTTTATSTSPYPSEVFRFDSTDRERYLCAAISEEEEVFAHETTFLSAQPFESPHIVLDSPTNSSLSGSQLQLVEDLPMLEAGSSNTSLLTPHSHMEAQSRVMARVHTGLAMSLLPTTAGDTGLYGGIPSSPISPLTPNTPLSPSPLFASDQQMLQHGFLAELYRRRCHSDSDLPCLPETTAAHHPEPTDLTIKSQVGKTHTIRPRNKPIPHPLTIPSKGGSLESDQFSSPQDSPLDLSIRSTAARERFASSSCDSLTTRFLSSLVNTQPHSPGVAVIHGDIASPTTRNSVALRYNLDVSPVVEEMPPGADMAFVCPVCGQMFSLHDRLAKHMASRHKSKPHDPNKNYPCDVCHRSFARSDMLTRHMRLHTGVKPYTCRTCGQVFSRSDHLSTHQRTHTGEKPYKCPQCCYSACRRDMITRHLRTHTRNSSSSSSDVTSTTSTPTSTTFSASDSFPSIEELRPIKMEPISAIPPLHSRPPSSSSSFAPDSPAPSSPALNIGGLSVQSPPTFLHKDP